MTTSFEQGPALACPERTRIPQVVQYVVLKFQRESRIRDEANSIDFCDGAVLC